MALRRWEPSSSLGSWVSPGNLLLSKGCEESCQRRSGAESKTTPLPSRISHVRCVNARENKGDEKIQG